MWMTCKLHAVGTELQQISTLVYTVYVIYRMTCKLHAVGTELQQISTLVYTVYVICKDEMTCKLHAVGTELQTDINTGLHCVCDMWMTCKLPVGTELQQISTLGLHCTCDMWMTCKNSMLLVLNYNRYQHWFTLCVICKMTCKLHAVGTELQQISTLVYTVYVICR
ncbi:unnamed protein product [Mytilus coruscus]|uniref:Uncharacterized protein n=1 Tax=Mytilus coruscus TaxID=42192 RepID=A0A6J8AVP5_MYTCO|nr:unnamed protein product [Mytilus coruscus]